MKRIKKFVSVLLAAVMVMAMGVTVSAQDVDSQLDGPGTVTVTNATIGAQYQLYKVFDAEVQTVDGKDLITYKWPGKKDWEANDYFRKADDGTITALTAAYKEGSQDQLSDGAIEWIKSNGFTIGGQVTATEETLVFINLSSGYYYVTSSVGEKGAITVDTAHPNATIIDKNQEPVWEEGKKILEADGKKATASDASFDSGVNYEISVHATNYLEDEQIQEYFIYDTLGAGLDYDEDTVVVKVGEDDVTSTATIAFAEDGRSFKITIPWVNADGESLYNANDVITVTYTATVNHNAEIAGDDAQEGNKNKAWFDYRTDGDTPGDDPYHESEEEETKVYTYALGIQKVDEKGAPLAGATFTIEGVQATGAAGVYEYVPAETEGAVTEFETDENGQLIIKGVDAGTYSVTELKAPEGYNMLSAPVEITAQRTSMTQYKKTHTVYYDADGNVVDETYTEDKTEETYTFDVNVSEKTIVNRTGAQLPSTGGIGTTLFYVIGGVLVLAAVILLITKKRMSNEA